MEYCDVVIVGAGAAGLMCAIEAGRGGRSVWLVDHAKAPGEKIRISGGGRCNFTNLHTAPDRFLSQNSHFAISALQRYRPQDFLNMVEAHGIAWHEKKLGQLFCDGSSRQIVDMLVSECRASEVRLLLETSVEEYARTSTGFTLSVAGKPVHCASLVIASGGPSIPKMGATGWGYEVARHFGLEVVTPRPALVPFTLQGEWLTRAASLSGLATDVQVRAGAGVFEEAMLFTHRGVSGPAMLQISSYWQEGVPVEIDLLPGRQALPLLMARKREQPRQDIATVIAEWLPKRMAGMVTEAFGIEGRLADLSHETLQAVAQRIHRWQLLPNGTEGYRTAEVTLGGVDTRALSSKTMECLRVPGLYFIGEVVDVTGWLGGYNFQWAWASGHAAGKAISSGKTLSSV